MDRFWKYKIDHVIFWLATICFHMYTRIPLIEKAGTGQFVLEIVVRNGLLIGLVYLNLLWLIPVFAKRQRTVLFSCLLTASVLVYALLKNLHDVYLNGYIHGEETHRSFFYNTFYNVSIAIFYLAFSIGLELSREWYEQRAQIRRIEFEKLNTELEYLKAQINPHFLFNSINTIYFQIDKQNNIARDTLSAFSEMLRYQLYECNGKEIPVEKEINYIRNYVELQRMRKDENYAIRMTVCPDLNGFNIAPLLIIPFIENAFKHVSHFATGNEIDINLSRKDDLFLLRVYNTCDHTVGKISEGGIGLRNVSRRLQLLYNGRHQLTTSFNNGSFEVNLSIRLIEST